ncbi:MAG: OmpH family outer membrane protein [Tunicatimonas sp.]
MKKVVISSLILLAGLTFSAQAQEAKIGFAQSDYILGLLPEAQAAQRDIAEFERKVGNRLNAMRQGLEFQAAQLQRELPNLSDTVRAQRENELRTLQQDITQEQKTAQYQLQFKEMQVLSPLRQKVDQAIDSVARANGYTYVFSPEVEGKLFLIHTQRPEEADVTSLVIKALGLTLPAKPSDQ